MNCTGCGCASSGTAIVTASEASDLQGPRTLPPCSLEMTRTLLVRPLLGFPQ